MFCTSSSCQTLRSKHVHPRLNATRIPSQVTTPYNPRQNRISSTHKEVKYPIIAPLPSIQRCRTTSQKGDEKMQVAQQSLLIVFPLFQVLLQPDRLLDGKNQLVLQNCIILVRRKIKTIMLYITLRQFAQVLCFRNCEAPQSMCAW